MPPCAATTRANLSVATTLQSRATFQAGFGLCRLVCCFGVVLLFSSSRSSQWSPRPSTVAVASQGGGSTQRRLGRPLSPPARTSALLPQGSRRVWGSALRLAGCPWRFQTPVTGPETGLQASPAACPVTTFLRLSEYLSSLLLFLLGRACRRKVFPASAKRTPESRHCLFPRFVLHSRPRELPSTRSVSLPVTHSTPRQGGRLSSRSL